MSDTALSAQTDPEAGKVSAIGVWVLYLIAPFTAYFVSPIGLIWAYVARGSSASWAQTHFDTQIRMFWTVLIWAVGLAVLGAVLLPLFGLGLLVWLVLGVVMVVLTVWWVIKSFLGLLRALGGRPN